MSEVEAREARGPERTRATQMMVLGTVVAVLAPLGGFLAGSMVGPARRFGDYDAMFLSMFFGLVVGGLGAIMLLMGLLRFVRTTRPAEPLA